MSRELRLYLQDIHEHYGEIIADTERLTFSEFLADRRTYRAVVYSLLIVGEAAKHVPTPIRAEYPEVDWIRRG